jgi:hypothetical protein
MPNAATNPGVVSTRAQSNAWWALAALVLLPAWASSAQQGGGTAVLTPVEAGDDINPLRVGLRRQRVDLRGPSGFDRLYRVTPGAVIGGVTIKDGGYARISGSTVVVYPRGAYSQVAPGVVRADAPAGTMYLQVSDVSALIGSPQQRSQRSMDGAQSQIGANQASANPAGTARATPPSANTMLPRALNARLTGEPQADAAQPTDAMRSETTITSTATSSLPSLWDDESYRQRRLGAIIDAAAREPR